MDLNYSPFGGYSYAVFILLTKSIVEWPFSDLYSRQNRTVKNHSIHYSGLYHCVYIRVDQWLSNLEFLDEKSLNSYEHEMSALFHRNGSSLSIFRGKYIKTISDGINSFSHVVYSCSKEISPHLVPPQNELNLKIDTLHSTRLYCIHAHFMKKNCLGEKLI